jgi:hypothetical protein
MSTIAEVGAFLAREPTSAAALVPDNGRKLAPVDRRTEPLTHARSNRVDLLLSEASQTTSDTTQFDLQHR